MDKTSISSKELRARNASEIPMQAKGFSDYDFWYYTRLSTADRVLKNHEFWVSSLGDMNDLDELELHEEEKEKVYALCFCNSNSEKIPMWYLYSGIAGKGASLGLTPSRMLRFLRSLEAVEGENVSGKRDTLSVGSDIELLFGWVFYRKSREPDQIRYKNKWFTLQDPDVFADGNYFLKAYPWEYEREFRLLFINRTETQYKRLIVPIPETLCDELKVRLGPELKESELERNDNLERIGKNPKCKLLHSELKIKMNLFHRNRKNLPDYLRKALVGNDPDIEPGTLCDILQGIQKCGKSTH